MMENILKKNILSNAGATIIGSAIQLLLIFLLPKLMSVEAFAGYITALALIAVSEMASDFGTRIWATRRFAADGDHPQIMALAIILKIIFSSILICTLLFLPILTFSPLNTILALMVAILQPSTDPVLWFVRGRQRLDIEAGSVVIWRVVNGMMLIMLASVGYGITAMLVMWITSSIARMVIQSRLPLITPLWPSLFSAFKNISWQQIMRGIKICIPLGISFLAMSLFQRLGVLELGYLGSKLDIAVYGIAFTLVASAGFIGTSITVSIFPQLSLYLEAENMKGVEQMVQHKLKLISLFILPICLAGIFIGPFIIKLAYNEVYHPAAKILIWLMPGLYISCLNFGLKYVLNALELNWYDFTSVLVGIILFSLITFLPLWDSIVLGVAFAWCGGEFGVFLIKIFVIWRNGSLYIKRVWLYTALFIALWVMAMTINGNILSFYGLGDMQIKG